LLIRDGTFIHKKRPEALLLVLIIIYDTTKPYGPSSVSKSKLVAIGADLGSSPETYNQTKHLNQNVGLVPIRNNSLDESRY